MSTQLDIDIATLVGELAEVPCDHSQHGTHSAHTDEAASHYVHGCCPNCSPEGRVYPACPGMVRFALGGKPFIKCGDCGSIHLKLEAFRVLGPVNK